MQQLPTALIRLGDCEITTHRMQNPDIYTELNKNTAKYADMARFLKSHEELLTWRPEERVLDAGCGPGDVTAHMLQPWLPQDFRCLLGVDVSAKMIKHAQMAHSSERVKFSVMDMGGDVSEVLHDEKYSPGFDKIFSFYVLHWLTDLERGIGNLFSLLRPGGQALLTFPVDRPFQRTYRKVHALKQWSQYFKGVERDIPPFPRSTQPSMEFTRMMEDAGFQVSTCQVKDHYSFYESIKVVKGLIESLDQDIDLVPPELKSKYLDDCVLVMDELRALCVEKNSVKQSVLTCLVSRPA